MGLVEFLVDLPTPPTLWHERKFSAYLESQRTEPIRKRFWDLKDFGAPATNSKHDEIAAATRAIYASESENESDDDAQDGTDKGSAPNDGDSSQPRASTAALLDYFKQRIKTYKPPANDDAKSQTDNSEPSMELKLLRKSLGVVVKDHPQHRCPPPLASFFDPRHVHSLKLVFASASLCKGCVGIVPPLQTLDILIHSLTQLSTNLI